MLTVIDFSLPLDSRSIAPVGILPFHLLYHEGHLHILLKFSILLFSFLAIVARFDDINNFLDRILLLITPQQSELHLLFPLKMLLLEAFLVNYFREVGKQLHVSNTYRFNVLHKGFNLLGRHVPEINIKPRLLNLDASSALLPGILISLFPWSQFPGLSYQMCLYSLVRRLFTQL